LNLSLNLSLNLKQIRSSAGDDPHPTDEPLRRDASLRRGGANGGHSTVGAIAGEAGVESRVIGSIAIADRPFQFVPEATLVTISCYR